MAHDYYKAYKRQRKTWEINPGERVKESSKRYKRTAIKEEVKQHLNEFFLEEECSDEDLE